ncbi:DUF4406 domain-containing protein [Bacteroides heparinolyticus]|uniref:DUF4406 domain-containing protein n=1 Tax=Prevotella heparinolytica TaxID=28113 RepID=UPI00359F6F5F
MKVYISGRITGLDYNTVKRRFGLAEELLASLSLEPVNPLKNGLKRSDEWIDHMCKDIKMLHSCRAIYMLDGWMDSKGATIEYDFAIRTGKIVLFESNIKNTQDSLLRIQNAVHEATGLQLNDYNTKSRKRDKFFARMLFVHHCKAANLELNDIARFINRDNSSMLYILNKYNDEYRFNGYFQSIADKVNEILSRNER